MISEPAYLSSNCERGRSPGQRRVEALRAQELDQRHIHALAPEQLHEGAVQPLTSPPGPSSPGVLDNLILQPQYMNHSLAAQGSQRTAEEHH